MKKSLVILSLLGLSAFSFAQNVNDEFEILRDMAATERKALVADNMQLTEEESTIFWPMYDTYRGEAKNLGTKKIQILTDFAENFDSMTDEKAIEIMHEYYKLLSDETRLKISTKDKMQKSLNPKLVMRFMQIENKMDAIINYAMAIEVPLTIKE